MASRFIPLVMLALMPSVAWAAMSPATPSGGGNANLVVCRAPMALPGSRLLGPQVCRINAVWAQYRKDGMDVAPDGLHLVLGEKYRTVQARHCRPASPGGGSIANMASSSLGETCD